MRFERIAYRPSFTRGWLMGWQVKSWSTTHYIRLVVADNGHSFELSADQIVNLSNSGLWFHCRHHNDTITITEIKSHF